MNRFYKYSTVIFSLILISCASMPKELDLVKSVSSNVIPVYHNTEYYDVETVDVIKPTNSDSLDYFYGIENYIEGTIPIVLMRGRYQSLFIPAKKDNGKFIYPETFNLEMGSYPDISTRYFSPVKDAYFFAYKKKHIGTEPIGLFNETGDDIRNNSNYRDYSFHTHELGIENIALTYSRFGEKQYCSHYAPNIDFWSYTKNSLRKYFLSNLNNFSDNNNNSTIINEIQNFNDLIKEEYSFRHNETETKEAVTQRVITSSSMSNKNKDILFEATLRNPNMTEYEYEYLKQELSNNTYEDRVISPSEIITKNKTINYDTKIGHIKPIWDDIINNYSYSDLSRKGINKRKYDSGFYDVEIFISNIEFVSPDSFLAEINYKSKDSNAISINNISSINLNVKGNYSYGMKNVSDLIYVDDIIRGVGPKFLFDISIDGKKYTFDFFYKPYVNFSAADIRSLRQNFILMLDKYLNYEDIADYLLNKAS